MAPRTSSLKQGTLSFASSKHGVSTATTGKAGIKPAATSTSRKSTPSSRKVSQESAVSVSTIVSDEDNDREAPTDRGVKRRKTSEGVHKPGSVQAVVEPEAPAHEIELPREDLSVLEKSAKLNKVYKQAKVRMGGLKPVHGEDQNKVFQILRVFDNSYEYGPSVGVTRLERWQRAKDLGLNPPNEICEILTTEQGFNEDMYKQSVFYDKI